MGLFADFREHALLDFEAILRTLSGESTYWEHQLRTCIPLGDNRSLGTQLLYPDSGPLHAAYLPLSVLFPGSG